MANYSMKGSGRPPARTTSGGWSWRCRLSAMFLMVALMTEATSAGAADTGQENERAAQLIRVVPRSQIDPSVYRAFPAEPAGIPG